MEIKHRHIHFYTIYAYSSCYKKPIAVPKISKNHTTNRVYVLFPAIYILQTGKISITPEVQLKIVTTNVQTCLPVNVTKYRDLEKQFANY